MGKDSVAKLNEDKAEGNDADGALDACVGIATVEPDMTESVWLVNPGKLRDAMLNERCVELELKADRVLGEASGIEKAVGKLVTAEKVWLLRPGKLGVTKLNERCMEIEPNAGWVLGDTGRIESGDPKVETRETLGTLGELGVAKVTDGKEIELNNG